MPSFGQSVAQAIKALLNERKSFALFLTMLSESLLAGLTGQKVRYVGGNRRRKRNWVRRRCYLGGVQAFVLETPMARICSLV